MSVSTRALPVELTTSDSLGGDMNMNDGFNAAPRLLIADDDETLCGVLSCALEKRGFKVSVAHDYQAALAAAAGQAPEFAVLDLKLGDASGLRLMRQLLDLYSGLRVVVLTGYASIATAIEAVKLGAHHYLTKPANADELVAALRGEDGAPSCACAISERPLSVNRLEWEHINRVLLGNNGNISATARVLGMHRRTLQRKLAKHPARH
jgi:two-component system response regulator RegA